MEFEHIKKNPKHLYGHAGHGYYKMIQSRESKQLQEEGLFSEIKGMGSRVNKISLGLCAQGSLAT